MGGEDVHGRASLYGERMVGLDEGWTFMVPEHAAHSLKGPVVILGDLPQANNLLRLILGDPDRSSSKH